MQMHSMRRRHGTPFVALEEPLALACVVASNRAGGSMSRCTESAKMHHLVEGSEEGGGFGARTIHSIQLRDDPLIQLRDDPAPSKLKQKGCRYPDTERTGATTGAHRYAMLSAYSGSKASDSGPPPDRMAGFTIQAGHNLGRAGIERYE